MKHCVLIYQVVDDYVERRTPFGAEHLALAQAAKANGDLFPAGAFANPVDGALLVFHGETGAAAEVFAQADAYVKNGLVTRAVRMSQSSGNNRTSTILRR
jgi:uncharacterized protein YciI